MNAVTKFNPHGALTIPAHIANLFGDDSNIEDRVTVPSLSYEGKVWTVLAHGEKRPLMKEDENGDPAPMSTMRVVILDYAKRRGRALYAKRDEITGELRFPNYTKDSASKPLCFSEDGIAPHASVENKQADKCEGCSMSIKGSKINDNGKSVAACAQHRMLAVVPSGALDFTPLRLKISITSDWDGQSPDMEERGWFAFSNFTSYLQKKSTSPPHTAMFVTKMTFDPNATWPKVMFALDRWLTEAEVAVVRPISKSDAVKSLLGGTWTVTGVDGEKFTKPMPLVDDGKKVAKPAPLNDDEHFPASPAIPDVKKPGLIVKLVDDDDGIPAVTTSSAKKTVPTKPVAKKVVAAPAILPVDDQEIKNLLAEWEPD